MARTGGKSGDDVFGQGKEDWIYRFDGNDVRRPDKHGMVHIQGIKTARLMRAEQGADGSVHFFKLADRHGEGRKVDNDREDAANDNHPLTIALREGAHQPSAASVVRQAAQVLTPLKYHLLSLGECRECPLCADCVEER
jgi:hypothetical protein